MRQKLLLLIGLSSAIYATQEISCVEFVNMPKAQAKAYIDNYRKEFELNHFKIKNHTEVDKQYIGMQGGISKHLLTCIELRRVTYYDVENVNRALILESLSKKTLNLQEETIYKASLNKNIEFYKPYSKSSIKNAQYMPLVFLTIQKSNQNYIVYEFRKNGSTIERYSKKVAISNPYIKFTSKNRRENQNYLTYLNNNQIKPKLKIFKQSIVKPNYPKRVTKPISRPAVNKANDKYSVVNSFDATKTSDKKIYSITRDFYPIKIKETKGKVYFLINDEEYFAYKKMWNKGTKKLGELE